MDFATAARLVCEAAKDFDDRRYPFTVYLDFCARLARAPSPHALADALACALAWKDGKVQVDPNGDHETETDSVPYRIGRAKPNTYSDQHRQVFETENFYLWAASVRGITEFDPLKLSDLQDVFHLWQSTVIPAFVLHCLNPRVFPLVDQHVIRACNFFERGVLEADVDFDSYANYHAFWLKLLREAGVDVATATLEELKTIDAGLWVLGKRLARGRPTGQPMADDADGERAVSLAPAATARVDRSDVMGHPVLTTASLQFKQRAVHLARTMSQGRAIAVAAEELGIDLRPSHRKYPWSIFHSWRQQGIG